MVDKKKTETKKPKDQKELPGMPAMTDLGKKAGEYVDVTGKITSWYDKLEVLKVELITLFKKEKRSSITVDGITLSYAHLEKDQIKVKRPEGRNE